MLGSPVCGAVDGGGAERAESWFVGEEERRLEEGRKFEEGSCFCSNSEPDEDDSSSLFSPMKKKDETEDVCKFIYTCWTVIDVTVYFFYPIWKKESAILLQKDEKNANKVAKGKK